MLTAYGVDISSVLLIGVAAFLVYWLAIIIYNRFFHPLRKFPGPFLGSITNWYYVFAIRFGRGDLYMRTAHEKYGPVIRLTPNMLQFAKAEAIHTIYSAKNVMAKSKWYDTFDPHLSKRKDLFSEQDEKMASQRRRIVAHLYTQAAVLQYEPCIQRVIDLFVERMEIFAESKAGFDISDWFRKYTFDVIGEMFYGKEGGFGFVRDNIDFNNWCSLLEIIPDPLAAAGYVPWPLRTPYFLFQMLFPGTRKAVLGANTVIDQAREAARQRTADLAAEKPLRQDILNQLIDIANTKGNEVGYTMDDVTLDVWVVIWAGSDTTAISIISIFYNILRNPAALAKLRAELDEAVKNGALKIPVRFNDAVKLPYLRSCVLEGMRMHPGVGLSLPRVVPPGGAEISGHYIPADSEVSINPFVAHFDKDVFGNDADRFVPERWTRDGEDAGANMERNLLIFGYGKRICIGKHISYTEMYKLIATLLIKYDFQLTGGAWTHTEGWFPEQRNVNVRVKRRQA